MHRFIFVLLLCCTNAIANDKKANDKQEICSNWENIARAAMTSRQAGVPHKIMLMLVSDETAVGIFRAAYDKPRMESVTDQQELVGHFIEFVVSECLKS